MLYDFEKLFKDNDFDENNPDLPKGIALKIQKFRNLQKSVTPETQDEINIQLDQLDAEIMKKLPDFFDIEDEAEIKRAEEEQKQKQKAEKTETMKKSVATIKEIKNQELANKKKREEEEAAAAKQKEIEELTKPAKSNKQALENLFKLGKTSVSAEDLKKAGFDTSFFSSPIGPHGCVISEYKLYRANASSNIFELTKK